jgi:hypothetical protein
MPDRKTEKKRACSDERKAYRRLNKDVGRERQQVIRKSQSEREKSVGTRKINRN